MIINSKVSVARRLKLLGIGDWIRYDREFLSQSPEGSNYLEYMKIISDLVGCSSQSPEGSNYLELKTIKEMGSFSFMSQSPEGSNYLEFKDNDYFVETRNVSVARRLKLLGMCPRQENRYK